jgi:hypothetical protein
MKSSIFISYPSSRYAGSNMGCNVFVLARWQRWIMELSRHYDGHDDAVGSGALRVPK